MEEKLVVDARIYPDDRSKFAYLHNRLSGTAALWIQPVVREAHATGVYNCKTLADRLEEGFLDQYAQENAL